MAAEPTAGAGDHDRVRELLGRQPSGQYEVVVRDGDGDPVVIRNAPMLDDGTPMPTRYWLVGREEVVAVSRLEAAGGVRAAEAAVDPEALADAHARYAAERDAEIPPGAALRPSGGVGGTRRGVKCLHAHFAWHLAGGDDPVGRWVADQLEEALVIDVAERVSVGNGTGSVELPTPLSELVEELTASDPPAPENLTNAIGAITDDLENLIRQRPEIADAHRVDLTGEESWHLAAVERGHQPETADGAVTIARDDLEDLFRTLATEPRSDRLHNPALEPARVDSVVATCCAVLAILRRLYLPAATFVAPASGHC